MPLNRKSMVAHRDEFCGSTAATHLRNIVMLLRKSFGIVTVIILLSGWPIGPTCAGQNKSSAIDTLMHSLTERGQFSGSVLVAENGKILYEHGFGKADVQHNVPFTPATPCYIASLTKQFTAMAIMILAEQQKLTYSDPLSTYFPALPAYAHTVTIKHLLNHTSGIPDYVHLGLEHPGLTNHEVLQALMCQDSLHFSPGERFEYSNSGYILLAMIIERVSGERYRDFLKDHIFDPLGMDGTLVCDDSCQDMPQRARGYNRFGDSADYDLHTYGEGGIYSTVHDLFKWDQALYTTTLVTQSTLAQAFTPARLNNDHTTTYGFGWGIAEYHGQAVYSHAGRYGGFNTSIKRFANDRNTIIILTNHDSKNMRALVDPLINILYDKSYVMPKLSVAELLYRACNVEGMPLALQRYRCLRQSNDSTYDFSESELNELGYQFLGMKRIADAIAVLKLNAEEYPASWNAYDGLGEAYMDNGENGLAIANYRHSLALNPENSNAILMLRRLTGK